MPSGDKSSRRFFAIRLAAKGFLALLLFASYATTLRAQTIQIKLVNGKTGRLITDRSLLTVWVGAVPSSGSLTIPTDKHGIALLRLTHNDSEINVPDCEGYEAENADYQKLANEKPKASKQEWAEFNKKYKYCHNFEVKNPIARYADTISVRTLPGDVSWKTGLGGRGSIPYVPCWPSANTWGNTTDFSTKDVLQQGIVTANTCGSATVSPNPGQLILFVRLPSNRELWDFMNRICHCGRVAQV
jgi:hypothetical protein